MPEWMRGVIKLAELVADAATASPITLALSVPTAAWVGVAAAASFVLARDRRSPSTGITEDGFEHLCSQPEGTPATYLVGGRLIPVHLGGATEIRGVLHLVARDRKRRNSTRYLIPEGLCGRVKLTAAGERERTLAVKHDVPWLLEWLLGDRAQEFAMTSRDDCLMVGTKRKLEEEFEVPIVWQRRLGASFGDVAMPRGRPGVAHFRTRAISGADEPADDEQELEPALVIFDSARGYADWRHLWRSAHHIVVLDRSQPSAEVGAQAVQQAFYDRQDEWGTPVLSKLPASFECVGFLRRA
jgi:hypothetical protein